MQVIYPGLPSHPQEGLMRRLANAGYGAGGILSLDLGSKEAADAVGRGGRGGGACVG
jgi:methionine-gamma-lyase